MHTFVWIQARPQTGMAMGVLVPRWSETATIVLRSSIYIILMRLVLATPQTFLSRGNSNSENKSKFISSFNQFNFYLSYQSFYGTGSNSNFDWQRVQHTCHVWYAILAHPAAEATRLARRSVRAASSRRVSIGCAATGHVCATHPSCDVMSAARGGGLLIAG